MTDATRARFDDVPLRNGLLALRAASTEDVPAIVRAVESVHFTDWHS